MLKILNALVAVFGGVAGALLVYYVFNKLVERLPDKWEARLKPYVFIGPAFLVIGLFLVYPAVRTVVLSFGDATSSQFVGMANYSEILASREFRELLFNNFLWIAIVPAVTVAIGLLVAVLADRLTTRAENIAKSVIFLPMAISFVGAATIWRFVYEARAEGQAQIGLLNAITTKLGFDPVSWLQYSRFNLNDLLLMIILVWMQAGFAMVLLSAAIKGVPDDTLEAARIDGASELQIFFKVVVPQIWPTVITVFITIVILVMKIFDVIYVMTGGNFGTDVIGNRFFKELFTFGNNGRAAALVVILLLAVIPVMIYQVRQFRVQESQR